MKITCKYCGIVEKPHHCAHIKRKTNRTRIDNKVYESKAYRKIRQLVLSDYNCKCLWSLYVDGKIRSADVTHHIVEVLEDESKATDYDNLIPLSDYSHKNEVHVRYLTDKAKTQGLLREMLRDYKNGDMTLGKYKGRVKDIGKL